MDPQPWTSRTPFPAIEDLDRQPAEACQAELGGLFGSARGFLVRLAAARPFGADEQLFAAAYLIARELPDAEAVELVNAQPRIASDTPTAAASAPSQAGDDADDDSGDGAWVDEELAGLNEVYEARFGFRYAVFDAGRPRAEIIPLIEASLRNDRGAELRRAVEECVAIAEDRLRRLRGGSSDASAVPDPDR